MINSIAWKLFLWIGAKLFDRIDIYAPSDEDADVVGITFSNDAEYIARISEIE